MGSVQSTLQCPHCKNESLIDDFNYKNNEDYGLCTECGYSYRHWWKRDKKGVLVTKDGSTDYRFENLIPMSETHEPFGVLTITPKTSGIVQILSILNEEHLKEVKENLNKSDLSDKKIIVLKLWTGIKKNPIHTEILYDCELVDKHD